MGRFAHWRAGFRKVTKPNKLRSLSFVIIEGVPNTFYSEDLMQKLEDINKMVENIIEITY